LSARHIRRARALIALTVIPARSCHPSTRSSPASRAPLEEMFAGVALTTRVLVRALLAHVLDRQLPRARGRSGVEGESEDVLLDGLSQPLLPANLPEPFRLSRADRREAFEEAAFLIREVGLALLPP